MAKIVDIQAQLAAEHTQAPGQIYFMPPEALEKRASCTPKLDIFSFGHLALYTVNQEFPQVQDVSHKVTRDMQEQGIVEREKRKAALDQVGSNHCLYRTITECLSDRPKQRPAVRVLNDDLINLSIQNPAHESYLSLVEEVHRLREVAQENAELKHHNDEIENELQLMRLSSAVDSENHRSTQQSMVRYKKERDAARAELEDAQARLVEEKRVNNEMQSVNHQRLASATHSENLRFIQEDKVITYKYETKSVRETLVEEKREMQPRQPRLPRQPRQRLVSAFNPEKVEPIQQHTRTARCNNQSDGARERAYSTGCVAKLARDALTNEPSREGNCSKANKGTPFAQALQRFRDIEKSEKSNT